VRLERWEEEIRELRARDAANEQASALLHNAQLHLLHTGRERFNSSVTVTFHFLLLLLGEDTV